MELFSNRIRYAVTQSGSRGVNNELKDLKQNEAQSARAESTHKGVN